MNQNCECPAPAPGESVDCKRHGVTKTRRQHELCRGVKCTPQQCVRYWAAWEAGRMRGQAGPVADPKPAAVAPQLGRGGVKCDRPSSTACVHRGQAIDVLHVSGCNSPPPIYACALHERCFIYQGNALQRPAIEASGLHVCRNCEDRKPPRPPPRSGSSFKIERSPKSRWVTTEELIADSLALSLPTGVSVAAGVARSGIAPAAVVALRDGLPLLAFNRHRGLLTLPFPAETASAEDLRRMAEEAEAAIQSLPPNVSAVAGESVAGMLQASLVAMRLHLPLLAYDGGLWAIGNGWRLDGAHQGRGWTAVFGAGVRLVEPAEPEPAPLAEAGGRCLIVDDTTFRGGSLRHARKTMQAVHRRTPAVYAVVYRNPQSKQRPDVYAVDLPEPHFLEWNLFNSVYNQWSAFDLDGVLCRNPTPHEDDDGEAYCAWMESVAATGYLPRRGARVIVTARLEKYRPQTESWLRRWGVPFESLVMGPWGSARERRGVARWKAKQLQAFPSVRLYVESEPGLAKQIAEISGVPVLCPQAKWIF